MEMPEMSSHLCFVASSFYMGVMLVESMKLIELSRTINMDRHGTFHKREGGTRYKGLDCGTPTKTNLFRDNKN